MKIACLIIASLFLARDVHEETMLPIEWQVVSWGGGAYQDGYGVSLRCGRGGQRKPWVMLRGYGNKWCVIYERDAENGEPLLEDFDLYWKASYTMKRINPQ